MSSTSAAPTEGPLEWEARMGRLAGAAALASAALSVASLVVQVSALGGRPDDESEALLRFDEHGTGFFLNLGLQLASYVLLAVALAYLLRVTMNRRPEALRWATGLLILAPVLLAVGGILNQLELSDVADKFVSSGPRTEARAEDLLDDRSLVGGIIGQGGALCLAISFVFVSLNAMRAGLLSRFMGVLGIIVGVLLVIPLLPGGQSTVQVFWVAALGLLFLGRWPGGRGPAWETGEAIPWPSATDARLEAAAEEPPGSTEPDQDAAPIARKRSRKKRKRRR